MNYICDTKELALTGRNVVSIGKFDGFHLGHQKLIRAMRRSAETEPGRQTVLLTFDTSPQAFLKNGGGEVLTTRSEKREFAERLGADALIDYPFDDEVRHMEAETFLADVLLKGLGACEIIAGPDCRFGYMGKGDTEFLSRMSDRYGYRLTVVEKARYRGEDISSSRIRSCLAAGQIEEVNAMLGYAYSFTGPVIHGRELGRRLGFPTANQIFPEGKLLPAFGVYRTRVWIDGIPRDGMTNVGLKPTVGSQTPSAETHLIGFSAELYGKNVKTEFLERIRPERCFPSVEALAEQLERDRQRIVRSLEE